MRHLMFIDITKNRQVVELPSYFVGQLARAELVIWDMEGFEKSIDSTLGIDKGPYYVQLRFIDFLDSKIVTDSSHSDMIPIPVSSFNGWKPASLSLSIPIGTKRITKQRFIVETYGPGKTPEPLVFPHPANPLDTIESHVILWLIIETEEACPYYN